MNQTEVIGFNIKMEFLCSREVMIYILKNASKIYEKTDSLKILDLKGSWWWLPFIVLLTHHFTATQLAVCFKDTHTQLMAQSFKHRLARPKAYGPGSRWCCEMALRQMRCSIFSISFMLRRTWKVLLDSFSIWKRNYVVLEHSIDFTCGSNGWGIKASLRVSTVPLN